MEHCSSKVKSVVAHYRLVQPTHIVTDQLSVRYGKKQTIYVKALQANASRSENTGTH